MIKFKRVLHTNGSGLWSSHEAAVKTTQLRLNRYEDSFGELRVYFDTKTWSTRKHGLIYTDRLWLSELRAEFKKLNINSDRISYSERGWQGHNYVSLDVNEKFMKDFEKLTSVTL